MADTNDVRDELFDVAEAAFGRRLTTEERDRLVDAYNRQDSGSIYARCLESLLLVFGIDLQYPSMLLEKAASVDRVKLALANLQQVAQAAARR